MDTCSETLRNGYPAKHTGGKPVLPLGTRTVTRNGYINVKTENGWKSEHVVIMEKMLGRQLIKGENVHHKNGNKGDNRLENLELWYIQQPCGQRVVDIISYLESTGYKVSHPSSLSIAKIGHS